MADSELIDNIVSNETLGIRKSPSVFKIAFICIILLMSAFLAFSFFMKAKADEEKTPLALGQPLNNPPQQTIKPIEAVAVAQAAPVVGVVNNQATQPQVVAVASPTAIQPATSVVSIDVKSPASAVVPVVNTPTANQIVPVTSGVIKPAPSGANNQIQSNTPPVQVEPSPKVPQVVATASPVEMDISSPLPKKPQTIKRKKVVKKVEVKEVKAVKTEETNTPAIPMEEGVTREEIIVIQ